MNVQKMRRQVARAQPRKLVFTMSELWGMSLQEYQDRFTFWADRVMEIHPAINVEIFDDIDTGTRTLTWRKDERRSQHAR